MDADPLIGVLFHWLGGLAQRRDALGVCRRESRRCDPGLWHRPDDNPLNVGEWCASEDWTVPISSHWPGLTAGPFCTASSSRTFSVRSGLLAAKLLKFGGAEGNRTHVLCSAIAMNLHENGAFESLLQKPARLPDLPRISRFLRATVGP